MNKRNTILLVAAFAAVSLTGCVGFRGNVSVPTTKYKDQDRNFELPKDMAFDSVKIEKGFVDKNGITNFTKIDIQGLKSKNNPDVIDAAGNANVQSMVAMGQLFQAGAQYGHNMLMEAAKLFANSQGVPVSRSPAMAPSPLPQPTLATRAPTVRPVPKPPELDLDGVVYQLFADDGNGSLIYKGKSDGKFYIYDQAGKKMKPIQ